MLRLAQVCSCMWMSLVVAEPNSTGIAMGQGAVVTGACLPQVTWPGCTQGSPPHCMPLTTCQRQHTTQAQGIRLVLCGRTR
jgi:hypothetical protein